MRVRVDPSRCQGHTICAMIASRSFELDDVDGHAHATMEDVPADQYAAVYEAANSCPEQAILVHDDHDVPARAARGPETGAMT